MRLKRVKASSIKFDMKPTGDNVTKVERGVTTFVSRCADELRPHDHLVVLFALLVYVVGYAVSHVNMAAPRLRRSE